MKDNKNISVDINEDSEIHPAPMPKRKPIGGIIMGIINLIIAIPAIVMFFVDGALLLEGIQLTFKPELNFGEGLGLAVVIIYGIIFTAALLILSIPSVVFFIVARFNRSKFFKISSIVVFALTVTACVLAIIAFVVIWSVNKFG